MICEQKTKRRLPLENLAAASPAKPKSERQEKTELSAEDLESAKKVFLLLDRSGGDDACWPITKGIGSKGYGRLTVEGRKKLAHRIMLELKLNRRLNSGECSLHRCDNPPCCNPAHLFPGTKADNMKDAVAKGRMASAKNGLHPESKRTHCPKGHEYNEENTIWEKKPRGIGRRCRRCNLDRSTRYFYKHQTERVAKAHEHYHKNKVEICAKLREVRGFDKANPRAEITFL